MHLAHCLSRGGHYAQESHLCFLHHLLPNGCHLVLHLAHERRTAGGNARRRSGSGQQLDAFQTTHVVAHYPNMNEAREAIQRNQIYAFLLIPKGTTTGLMSDKQPKISFYYSSVSLVSGSLLYRDLKTISTLGSAGVGMTKLSAIGKTENEIRTFLQPIAVDLHMINNPWVNYNVYLSTTMVPGVLMIFIFLLTPYSIGTELASFPSCCWVYSRCWHVRASACSPLA